MHSNKILVVIGLAVIIAGAGCVREATVENTGGDEQQSAISEEAAAGGVEASPSATEAVVIDDTWNTYVSRGGDWQFKWPTKGKYAPNWEVDFAAEVVNGCFGGGEQRRVTLGDADFCHTSSHEGNRATDYYVTDRDGQHIRLSFTKVGGDGFDWNGYAAFLDQVVGTFKVK